MVVASIIGAALAIDMVVAVVNVGRPYDACNLVTCIIMEGVTDKCKLGVLEIYVIVEDSLAGRWTILSPFTSEGVVFIYKFPALEEVTQVVEPIIIK